MPNHLHAIVEICNDNGDDMVVDDIDVNNIVAGDFTVVDELTGDDMDVDNIVAGDFTVVDELAGETLDTRPCVSAAKSTIPPNPRYIDHQTKSTHTFTQIHFIIHGGI